MRGLLDTHTFIWWDSTPSKLSAAALSFLQNRANTILLSVASVWEILIKVRAGKLALPDPSGPYLVKKLAESRIEVLPIKLDHVLRIESLPVYHRDPFDRILIAQSLEEELPLITADPVFERYRVDLIW